MEKMFFLLILTFSSFSLFSADPGMPAGSPPGKGDEVLRNATILRTFSELTDSVDSEADFDSYSFSDSDVDTGTDQLPPSQIGPQISALPFYYVPNPHGGPDGRPGPPFAVLTTSCCPEITGSGILFIQPLNSNVRPIRYSEKTFD